MNKLYSQSFQQTSVCLFSFFLSSWWCRYPDFEELTLQWSVHCVECCELLCSVCMSVGWTQVMWLSNGRLWGGQDAIPPVFIQHGVWEDNDQEDLEPLMLSFVAGFNVVLLAAVCRGCQQWEHRLSSICLCVCSGSFQVADITLRWLQRNQWVHVAA